MSRGGRGGGRGGRRMGPDMSWQDEDTDLAPMPVRNVPAPMFPPHHLPTPKPLSPTEKSSLKSLLSLREQIHLGPLHTVLEPSTLLDAKGRSNPRAGFDPFNDQERYTRKYHRKRRIVPDLTTRSGYTLPLFPLELWPILDPRRKQKEYWDTLSDELKDRVLNASSISANGKNKSSTLAEKRGTKRKREKLLFDDVNHNDDMSANVNASDTDDSITTGSRRRRKQQQKAANSSSRAGEKKGLDAEDDYPDVDQTNENDADPDNPDGTNNPNAIGGANNDDDEPVDSEFGSDDEDGEDDYNAENYFDGGDDDEGDYGDGGGGDDDGGGGGGDYY